MWYIFEHGEAGAVSSEGKACESIRHAAAVSSAAALSPNPVSPLSMLLLFFGCDEIILNLDIIVWLGVRKDAVGASCMPSGDPAVLPSFPFWERPLLVMTPLS